MPNLRFVLQGSLLCLQAAFAWPPDWPDPAQVPDDPVAAVERSDEYAWRLFIALNWPRNHVGHADPGRASWESWANAADVYRHDGADPGPWHAAGDLPIATQHRFEAPAAADLPNARHVVAGRMVPLRGSLARAARLVEIRMNRVAFDYIRAEELYNLDGQIRHVAAGVPVKFPAGAIELKASWRPIDAAEQERYHTLRVRFADGSTRLFGLDALNIAAKEQPEWFWASFEHVDNASRPGAEGWKLPSRDVFACGDAPPDCNRFPAGLDPVRGAWRNYRLRGTMTRYLDAAGNPQRLGNSQLEAGLQDSASCMTCHARAALALVDGMPERLPVFDVRRGEDVRARRGFVGVPDAAWYQRRATDGNAGTDFMSLDFVWSLAQARLKAARPTDTNGAHR